jgi:hypothetical protein
MKTRFAGERMVKLIENTEIPNRPRKILLLKINVNFSAPLES